MRHDKMDATATITVLVDDKAGDGLITEHGFSLWIEIGGNRILFDTGHEKALVHNAEKLGIRLEDADAVILSHGHYDHSGGIPHILRKNAKAHVYVHPGAGILRYSIPSPDKAKAVHMPQEAQAALAGVPSDRLHVTTQPVLVAPGIGLTGPIPRKTDFEDTGGPFFLDPEARTRDLIDDDQALWMKTPQGLVIISGCSHSGIINTIAAVRNASGETIIAAIIGGLHLRSSSAERLAKTNAVLRTLNMNLVVPCHCTGDAAVESLRASLGELVKPGHAGFRISV